MGGAATATAPKEAVGVDHSQWPGCRRLGIPAEVQAAIVSRDRRAMVETLGALSAALQELSIGGQQCRMHVTTAVANVCRGRNDMAGGLRERLGRDRAWVLWLDDDILLQDPRPVVEAVRRSWTEGVGFVADYHMRDGRSHIMRARGATAEAAPNYTQDELAELPDWHPVYQCGMGFCFLPLDLTYCWRADHLGEDVCFFLDTQTELRFAKGIKLHHLKTVLL